MKYSIGLFALVVLFISTLAMQSAQARLGENLQQCRDRYGMFAKKGACEGVPDAQFYTFTKSGIDVEVIIWNGRCSRITYSKGGVFTPAEIALLSMRNSENQPWTSEEKDGVINLARKDKKAEGYYEKTPRSLTFVYVDYQNEEKAREAGKETGLEGF
ncbi:hypothetical protein DB346_10575 [Verrucomicrobia bacterium LW23]|nr:hypothetical protein DB346_10575 [Verrucomicrobia bacterium LW23]